MLHLLPSELRGAPYVIVAGNEKGGSGKTTIAMHVAIALLKEGQRVGTIDLDGNQRSLTRYIENRRLWAKHRGLELEVPLHQCIQRAQGASVAENEAAELANFEAAVASLAPSVDFLVIDTPANDSYLMRLAHLMADTLLTPLNESFLDFATLAPVDPITHELTEVGHYASIVAEARRHRRLFDRGHVDWFIIRNRYSEARLLDESLDRLTVRLGCRPVDGYAERLAYRQLFPMGLTAFDTLNDAALGDRPHLTDLAAQQEAYDLYALLQLPTNSRARRRAAARAEWFASADAPLELSDVLTI